MVKPRLPRLSPGEPCWWCKGTGYAPVITRGGEPNRFPCPRCDGTGKLPVLRDLPLPGERL